MTKLMGKVLVSVPSMFIAAIAAVERRPTWAAVLTLAYVAVTLFFIWRTGVHPIRNLKTGALLNALPLSAALVAGVPWVWGIPGLILTGTLAGMLWGGFVIARHEIHVETIDRLLAAVEGRRRSRLTPTPRHPASAT